MRWDVVLFLDCQPCFSVTFSTIVVFCEWRNHIFRRQFARSSLTAISPRSLEKLTVLVSRAFLLRQYVGTRGRRPLIAFTLAATLFAAAINISAIEFEENNGSVLERDKSESLYGTNEEEEESTRYTPISGILDNHRLLRRSTYLIKTRQR